MLSCSRFGRNKKWRKKLFWQLFIQETSQRKKIRAGATKKKNCKKNIFCVPSKNCWHNLAWQILDLSNGKKNQTNLDYSAILKYYNFSKLGHFKCLRWGRRFKNVFCSAKRVSLLEIPNKKWSYCLLIIFWLIRASLIIVNIMDFRVNEDLTSIL